MKLNQTLIGTALAIALSVSLITAARAADTPPLGGMLDQLKSSSTAAGDAQLKSLGGDLASKVGELGKSFGKDSALTGQLTSGLQSLLGGKSAESVALLGKLSKAKLTPQQTKLAKETWNLGSAYAVQRDLGALDGASGDIGTIVNSLRKGNATQALPAIQKVAKEAKLTAGQKELLTSLADQYAPGIGKASESLDGLKKSIPGLTQ
jgi:hypothetical protein